MDERIEMYYEAGCSYGVATAAAVTVTISVDFASPQIHVSGCAITAANPSGKEQSIAWRSSENLSFEPSTAWEIADTVAFETGISSNQTNHVGLELGTSWEVAETFHFDCAALTINPVERSLDSAVAWGLGNLVQIDMAVVIGAGVNRSLDAAVVWGKGARQDGGGYPAIIVPAPPLPPTPSNALLYILPARYFLMAHTLYIERISDSLELPFYDCTVSTDIGSFCWSFSGSGHASLMQLLTPVDGVPVKIRAWLDGIEFVFAVDKVNRNRSFGKSGVTVTARSVTSSIAAPTALSTARTNQQDMTAYQICSDALTDSGIDLDFGAGAGVDANGGIVDWLVPAGAFSNIGTPLQAVQSVVEAAGGYVQSHRNHPILLARHPYGGRIGDAGGAPWQWMDGSADVELAPDSVITESIERMDGADINGVYVSGTTHGVLGIIKITGTAGDKLAPMVTDSLITHIDAARQRGLSILGEGGKKQSIKLDLPVLVGAHQPGILSVGQLVQVNSTTPWRGRVQSVSVDARLPTLRQAVTLERYLG